jgi:putative intracellular protease/amidase
VAQGVQGDRRPDLSRQDVFISSARWIAGAEVSRSAVDFDPSLVEDRELITGHNPRSDLLIGAALIKTLEKASIAA